MLRRLLLLGAIAFMAGCTVPRWPVDGPVTSAFGIRRSGLDFSLHHGVDISVPAGTEVRAMAPGRVAFTGAMRGYGLVVAIDHAGGIRSLYAHLSEILVERGQELRGRPVVALSGSSGRASGPHLHFEIQRGGNPEDPVALLGGLPRRSSP